MSPIGNRKLLLSIILASVFCIASQADELHPPRRILTGHQGSVLAVRLTLDGRTLVSGSRDDTIKIWDLATGTLRRTLKPHAGDADFYALAFSRDGKVLASGGRSKVITLWDAKSFTPIRTLEGHAADIRWVEFSPDDKTLASASEDNTFRLWDVATGRLKVTRAEHTGKVKTVMYSPDGTTIFTGSSDSTIRRWDAKSGSPKQVLSGAHNGLEFCEVSPDGRLLFAGTGNIGEIIFFNARSGEMLRDIMKAHGNEHGEEIDSGCFTPDGRYAISGSKDRSLKFWDTRTFAAKHVISGLPGRVESMTISPDGKTFVTGFGGTDFTIAVWDFSRMP